MDKKIFDSIIPYKVRDAVLLIMETENIDFMDALTYFYHSKLASALANEETKLWHLSPRKLVDILSEEKITNTLTYPDFV
jgi:hypothetical protein